jgi:phosphoribosyl 1,2-cyclic phosphodiesterase
MPEVIERRIREILEKYISSQLSVNEFLSKFQRQNFGGYGGHTACVDIRSSKQNLIVDAGSGIRPLGEELMNGPCAKGQGVVDILFTHFHWDHLVGLPFFTPIFIPGNKIRVHAVQTNVEEVFRHVFQKPYFPVPYERLAADIEFHHLQPRQTVNFGDIKVTPYQLDHPDPCWCYKFEQGTANFAYCVDTEGVRASPEAMAEDLPLYQDIDLMVFDAQYTFAESIDKIDWGHSSGPIGIDIALREKVKRVIFIHHDPSASDQKIFEAELQTREYFEACVRDSKRKNIQLPDLQWEFGYDGMEIEL